MLNRIGQRIAQNFGFWAGCLIILSIYYYSQGNGNWGAIGRDSDDKFRLLQIRDFLAGQSWFDMTQYRLGPDGGTLMHWSRIPDIPLIILIQFFDLFLPAQTAENWAISIWPPLSAGGVIAGLLLGARHLGGQKAGIFILVILATYLFRHYRFTSGAIDHHNLQLGFISLAMGGVLSPVFGHKSYALAGFAAAMCLGIGLEVNFFIAIICAYVALVWGIKGDMSARGVRAFGLALSLSCMFIFITTVAPPNYGQIYCDAFSLIYLIAGVSGGLGLAGLTVFLKGSTLKLRMSGLLGLGLVCGALLASLAPQCLSNPLDVLPENVRTLWLGQIDEAEPLRNEDPENIAVIIYFLTAPFLALCLSLRQIYRREQILEYGGLACLLIVAIAMTCYQVRFYVFGHIFALIPLAVWLGRQYETDKARNPGSVKYLLSLVAVLPIIHFVVGVLLIPSKAQTEVKNVPAVEATRTCYDDKSLAIYETLPQSTILTDSGSAAHILLSTPHRALFGNYHRNIEGIATALNIFTADTETARRLLRETSVGYIHLCKDKRVLNLYSEIAPDSFLKPLYKGDYPDFLEPIHGQNLSEPSLIYKVTLKPKDRR